MKRDRCLILWTTVYFQSKGQLYFWRTIGHLKKLVQILNKKSTKLTSHKSSHGTFLSNRKFLPLPFAFVSKLFCLHKKILVLITNISWSIVFSRLHSSQKYNCACICQTLHIFVFPFFLIDCNVFPHSAIFLKFRWLSKWNYKYFYIFPGQLWTKTNFGSEYSLTQVALFVLKLSILYDIGLKFRTETLQNFI